MNTHLKQLWAAMKLPEKLQKSYKFFCRGLDIRVTETMKADNQMLWVQSMNSIRNRAEEIIRQEMIYC